MPKSRNKLEQSTKLARRSVEAQFKKRAGEAIVAATIPELIRVVPCSSGIQNQAMVDALQEMKHDRLIKVRTRPSDGQARIRLTPRGRAAFKL